LTPNKSSDNKLHVKEEKRMDDEIKAQAGLNSPSLECPPPEGVHMTDDAEKRAPLLMQRPPSFGVDLAEFSFMKPASRNQGFSLRGMPKPGRINPPPLGVTNLAIPKTMGFEILKPLAEDRYDSIFISQNTLLFAHTPFVLATVHPTLVPKQFHPNCRPAAPIINYPRIYESSHDLAPDLLIKISRIWQRILPILDETKFTTP
jgi:hypothetical protein